MRPVSKDIRALRQAWEARARSQGDRPAGVLFKGLPDDLNQCLHEAHADIARREWLPRVVPGGQVLDLAGGYGRMARVVRAVRPDLRMIGLDFSQAFCRRYRLETTGGVVCGDLTRPPFREGGFDALLAVTALMYVEPAQRGAVMRGWVQLLRPGGSALLIDPGRTFMRWVGRLYRPTVTTGGYAFDRDDYGYVARCGGARVVAQGGLPGLSWLLPLLYVGRVWPAFFRGVWRLSRFADRRWWRYDGGSIHRWMVVERPTRSAGSGGV